MGDAGRRHERPDALEDGSEPLTATTPFGRARRRALALAITAPAAIALWVGILATAVVLAGPAQAGHIGGWPVGGLLIELAALCGTGWLLVPPRSAGAAGGDRRRERPSGCSSSSSCPSSSPGYPTGCGPRSRAVANGTTRTSAGHSSAPSRSLDTQC